MALHNSSHQLPNAPSDWTISTLKDYLDSRIEEREQRLQEYKRQTEDRFHTVNGNREIINDYVSKMVPRAEVDAKLSGMEERIENVDQKADIAGRPNWPLLGVVATLVASSVLGVWVIIGLKIESMTAPVNVQLKQIETQADARDRSLSVLQGEINNYKQGNDAAITAMGRDVSSLLQGQQASRVDRQALNDRMRIVENSVSSSQSADATSQTDRRQLNERLKLLEAAIAQGQGERRAADATQKQKLAEVETQFLAVESELGTLRSHLNQWLSLLWNKVWPGTVFPPDVYNPTLHRDTKD